MATDPPSFFASRRLAVAGERAHAFFPLPDGIDQVHTLPQLLAWRAKRTPDGEAYRAYDGASQRWCSTTWAQAHLRVQHWGQALAALALPAGARVALLLPNGLDAVTLDQAALALGHVPVPLHAIDNPASLGYIVADSEASLLVVQELGQWQAIRALDMAFPELRAVVVASGTAEEWPGTARVQSEGAPDAISRSTAAGAAVVSVLSLADWLAQAKKRPSMHTPPCAADMACIVYTSGTTGKPKGAMHTHGGLCYTARGYNTLIARTEDDECMCFLPLCHIAERMGGEYFSLYTGAKLNFVENPDTVPENVREIAPTNFTAVPRVWEKFYSGVAIALKEGTRLQQATYAWGIGVGQRIAGRVLAGQPVPASLKAQFRVARWLALDNVRKLIGIHRARFLVTGAAPISPELVKWYLALGVPMLEVWGMTETCGASTGVPATRIKPGSIGPAADFNQVRLDPDTGEIQVKGPNVFAGYLNLPEKTAETFTPDGWLRTGDVGTVDADGFYRITDRMKDIIITAGGKNVTPSELENELKFSPYVTDAVVVGDARAYLTVIIMIDQENVEKYAQDHDVPFSNYASLTRAPEVQALIQGVIDDVNKKFARVEQIKKFFLLDTQLTAEDEELTPTMKLKRKLVQAKYAPQIEAMYH